MKVLGIDPGIERLGWCIAIRDGASVQRLSSGVKKTKSNLTKEIRLYDIHDFLEKLVKKEKPNVLGIESLFFSTNAKTAITIGEVRGVVLAIAGKYKLDVKEFSPPQIKLAICGYGNAGKKDVASMLKHSINVPPYKALDDETDAVAIALTALFHRN
jgi:crossover junction endodeoxyribonuclease RuvC